MDNLTHSLAGIVAAELIVQVRAARIGSAGPERRTVAIGSRAEDVASASSLPRARGGALDPRWHRAVWWISAAAHNAPDLDFAYTWITGGKLGYLLHHRGHTHTLALAPLMAGLAYLIVWAWARRGAAWSRADHGWAALIAGLGPIGHILLDLSNNYGVHPFWPISNAWYAADTVFIIEPLFWASTIPSVLLATTPRAGRIAWTLVLAAALALPWIARFFDYVIPIASSIACTGIGLTALAINARIADRARAAFSLGASLLVLAAFAVTARMAEAEIRSALGANRGDRTILDVARAPMPATPLCWETLVVSRTAERYQISIARVALLPALIDLDACSRNGRRETTAELERGVLLSARVRIEAELDAPIDALVRLADRCDGAAFLRFARAPFVHARANQLVAGDLRYDRDSQLGFAELELTADPPERCPERIPPWEPWRARDLLAE